MSIGQYPWDIVGVDQYSVGIMTPRNKDCTVTFADYFGRGVVCEPCDESLDSEEYAHLTCRTLIRRKGVPRQMICDRGSQFVSKLTKAIFEVYGCSIKDGTAIITILTDLSSAGTRYLAV